MKHCTRKGWRCVCIMAFIHLLVGKTYVYGWNRMGRKDELCVLHIIARRMDSVMVEFIRDGYQAVTSGKALREVPAGYKPPQPRLF